MMSDTDTVESLSDLKDLTGEAPAPEAPEAPTAPATPSAPLRPQELDGQGRAYATGRRKDAVARVWLKPGSASVVTIGLANVPATFHCIIWLLA